MPITLINGVAAWQPLFTKCVVSHVQNGEITSAPRSNDPPRRLSSLLPREPAPVRIQPRQKSPLETGTHKILLTGHSTIVALSRTRLVINSFLWMEQVPSQLPTPNSFVGGTRYREFPHEIVRPPRWLAERTYSNIKRWTVMERVATLLRWSNRTSSPKI